MLKLEEELDLIKKLYVNNGEYQFDDRAKADKFAKDLYWEIHDMFSSGGLHHKYNSIEEFIYSHDVDSAAYWLYDEIE